MGATPRGNFLVGKRPPPSLTAQSCHPKANANFIQYDPHADYRNRERHPVLFGIWIYFIIIMSGAFGFFGLHTIFWFLRSAIERMSGWTKSVTSI